MSREIIGELDVTPRRAACSTILNYVKQALPFETRQ